MNKETIHFDIELFQGYTCIGCAVVNDLAIEVEFTDEEIAQMKQLVSKVDETDYSRGIMPVLADGAPELYKRIDDEARSEIFDFYVEDGIRQSYIEFEDDELRRNFLKDYNLTEEEYDKDLYYDIILLILRKSRKMEGLSCCWNLKQRIINLLLMRCAFL